jgi:hypothetical protein
VEEQRKPGSPTRSSRPAAERFSVVCQVCDDRDRRSDGDPQGGPSDRTPREPTAAAVLRHVLSTVLPMQNTTPASTRYDDDVPQQDDLVVLWLEVGIVVTFMGIVGFAALCLA